MKPATLQGIREASTASAGTMWALQIEPALNTYRRCRGDAVSAAEIAEWQRRYAPMRSNGISKRKAARRIAMTSRRSEHTIRRYISWI